MQLLVAPPASSEDMQAPASPPQAVLAGSTIVISPEPKAAAEASGGDCAPSSPAPDPATGGGVAGGIGKAESSSPSASSIGGSSTSRTLASQAVTSDAATKTAGVILHAEDPALSHPTRIVVPIFALSAPNGTVFGPKYGPVANNPPSSSKRTLQVRRMGELPIIGTHRPQRHPTWPQEHEKLTRRGCRQRPRATWRALPGSYSRANINSSAK